MAFLVVTWLVLAVLAVVVQLRYAYANYPRSWRWEALLISSSFACGSVLGLILFGAGYKDLTLASVVIACGLAFAFIYRFLFVYNVQHVIPKRKSPTDNNSG